MSKKIKILFAGIKWVDITHNKSVGDAKELINYVNNHRYTVDNDDCFLHSRLFWYNQGGK